MSKCCDTALVADGVKALDILKSVTENVESRAFSHLHG